MTSNIEKYRKAVDKLYATGVQLQLGMLEELGMLDKDQQKEVLDILKPISFKVNYERWYSEALAVIKQILPDRVSDFVVLYKNDKRKVTDYLSYTISDYLIGLKVTRGYEIKVNSDAGYPKYQQQLAILEATRQRFDSLLFDIKQLLQADLFDTELEAAKELAKKGFLRAAGAIAGVLIEKHLKEVLTNRKINVVKKNAGIADLNELLKNNNIIDIPQWRQIQLLADYRNLCDHSKSREPKIEEIDDLLNGTNKILKTIH